MAPNNKSVSLNADMDLSRKLRTVALNNSRIADWEILVHLLQTKA